MFRELSTVTRRFAALAVAAAGVLALPAAAAAQIGPIVRVEQDWEVVIKSPDTNRATPQLALWMRPDPALDAGFLVTINYQDTPAFATGGVGIQGWHQDACLGSRSHLLGRSPEKDERIEITTFMEIANGKASFGVSKGKSKTFGDLSKAGLTVANVQAGTTSLARYSTQDSVDNCLFTASPERVGMVKITQVRAYDAKGVKLDLPGANVPIPNR